MLNTNNYNFFTSDQDEELLPPISRWTSLTGIILVGSVSVGVALSSWVKYNVVVKAAATARPTGEIRVVQSEIEGTVKNILVKENQSVKLGDVIADLNSEKLEIQKNQLQDTIRQIQLQSIQIDAQIRTLNNQILAEKRVIERIVASAQADLLRNQRDYQNQQITTQNELLSAEANLQKAQSNLQKAQSDLDFAKLDSDRYQQLSEIGAIGRREFEQKQVLVQQAQLALQSERKSVEIAQLQVKSAQATINPTMAMVKIAQERVGEEIAKGDSLMAALNKQKQELFERQLELQTQIKQSQKELKQVENQIKSSVILATSNGTILKLNLRNPGQVVRSSEAIAEIVPNHVSMVVKAVIPNGEVKKVNIGQNVKLRIDACPYPDYGTLDGVVKAVSPDIITTQNNNLASSIDSYVNSSSSYFEVTIEPETLVFGNQKRQCKLQPGMTIQADIISKEETVMQFILRKTRLVTDL